MTPDEADLARRSSLSVEVRLASSDITPGAKTRAVAVVRDARGNILTDRQVTWSSQQSTVAKVDANGVVTGINAGTTTIRATSGTSSANATLSVGATSSAAVDPSECGTPQSGWIFCDDFEQDRTSRYYEYDNAGGKFVRASGSGLNGSVGMQATYTKGQTSAGHLSVAMGRTPSSYFRPVDAGTANYRELYWRFYTIRAPGWVGNGPAKLTRATIFAKSDWSQAMIAHGWTDDTDKRYLLLDPASGTNTSGSVITSGYNDFGHLRWLGPVRSSTMLEDQAHVGQWECYEFHVKLNTAGKSDGLFELAVNDTLSARRSGLNWIGSYSAFGLNAVLLEQYQGEGAPAANVRVLDNFVVSTQPIGCGGSSPSAPSNAVASVTINPSAPSGIVGQTVQLAATTRNASGDAISGRSITWTSGNSAVATVSASGLVTLLSAGSTTISATSDGVRGEVTVTASRVPVATVRTSLASSTILRGTTTQASATLLDASGNTLVGRTITWSSSNTAVATVTSSGVVTGVAAGTANIVAASEGKSGVAPITVTAPAPVATALGITRQPSSTATSGLPFAQQPVIQLRDASGKAISQSGVAVNVAIATGGGTLSGTTTATTNASGVATFSGLAISGSTGSRTLSFSASKLASATSSTISVTAAITSGGNAIGSSSEPTPAGTIVLDTRAGGAQDIQRASSISEVRSYWTKTGGVLNGIGFTTDYNGAGKHAFRVDWNANPSGESSYNDNMFYFPSTMSTIYASVVIHLGRTATGGGLGNIGSFTPVTDRGGMKRMMWLRQRDNGTDRVYWVWPTEGQRSQQNALSIDNTNFNSYFNADYGVGQDVRWTFALIPGNPGTVRVWRNGVLVLENLKANIGTKGFEQLQFITTRFAAQQSETEYWTDLVVWKP